LINRFGNGGAITNTGKGDSGIQSKVVSLSAWPGCWHGEKPGGATEGWACESNGISGSGQSEETGIKTKYPVRRAILLFISSFLLQFYMTIHSIAAKVFRASESRTQWRS
jgi:hypothetical protein